MNAPANRPPPRDVSLRRLIVSRIVIYVVPIVAIMMVALERLESKLLTELFDDSLRERAMSIATLVTTASGKVELDFADEYMPQYAREDDPYYFQIWLPDGRVLEKSISLGDHELPRTVGTVDEPHAFTTTLGEDTRVRAVGIDFPVRLETDPGTNPAYRVSVVVAAHGALLRSSLTQGLVQVLVTGTLSAFAITLVVFAALHRASRLLQRIVDEVHTIDRSALDRRLDVSASPTEIRPILAALNESLDAIADSVARERRFHSDVAHELRTPIAELRAVTEVALRWPDQTEGDEAMRDAHDIALQMGDLVESLLQLSRLESGRVEGDRDELDLRGLVDSQLERVARMRGASPDRVRVEAGELPPVHGNRALWEVVIGNLLDNALEHSPAGSRVGVDLASSGDGVTLRVENEVNGFSADDLSHATRRLWRGDSARGHGAHFGLGLSIAQAASNRLGAGLSLSVEGERFVATVRA